MSSSSNLQNLESGETTVISMRGGDFSADPVWQCFFVPGLASFRLLPDGEPAGRNRIFIRMGAQRSAPAPLPAGTCGLCESSKVQERVRIPEMSVGICPQCHSGMVLGMEAAIGRPGADNDYSTRYAEELQAEKGPSCWRLLLERTDNLKGVENLLDIGCGAGAFLDLAREAGLSTAGLEVAPNAALAAVRKGHEIYCKSVEVEAFPPGQQFDLIVMWDILEHLAHPRLALGNAFRLLAPGGRLFVLTPMMGSVFDQLGMSLARLPGARLNQLLRMCWSEDHLFRFHPRGLVQVLSSLGFTQVKAEPTQLLSLKADRYAGGQILKSWTGSPFLDQKISQVGVTFARALRISNKILIEAARRKEGAGQ